MLIVARAPYIPPAGAALAMSIAAGLAPGRTPGSAVPADPELIETSGPARLRRSAITLIRRRP